MTEDHDGVETEAHDGAGAVTGDQADGLSVALAEGESSIRVEDEATAAFFTDMDLDIGDASMLLGTMRDHVLDGLRKPVGWPKLTEAQQHSINVAVEHGCKVALRGAFKVAAARSFPSMEMQIIGVTKNDKRVIEAKLRAPYDLEDWRKIGEASVCVLLPGASSEDYEGALPARVDKDQPDLIGEETPEQRKTREAMEFEAAAQEKLLAGFKPLDEGTTTLGNEVAKALGDKLPPAIKAAADRGRALRLDGGACKIPKDLEGKPSEVNAFLKAWEAADREAGVTDEDASAPAPAPAAAEPAKAPRGHRGKRTSSEERTAKRLAEASA